MAADQVEADKAPVDMLRPGQNDRSKMLAMRSASHEAG
jgi:hypothetical protein